MFDGDVAHMPKRWIVVLGSVMLMMSGPSFAVHHQFSGVAIGNLRAVGDYQGSVFDNTLEIHPKEPFILPSTLQCTAAHRVFIDARHKHLVATAQLALVTGRKVNIAIDDALPLRNGACEVTYLDIPSDLQ